jgi:hypothetical protein
VARDGTRLKGRGALLLGACACLSACTAPHMSQGDADREVYGRLSSERRHVPEVEG